jgi:hypothetical protein
MIPLMFMNTDKEKEKPEKDGNADKKEVKKEENAALPAK